MLNSSHNMSNLDKVAGLLALTEKLLAPKPEVTVWKRRVFEMTGFQQSIIEDTKELDDAE